MGALEFFGVVDLDQHVHAPVEGCSLQLSGLAVIEAGHDDQNAVGPQRTGLGDLVGVEHEVLAQAGQVHGGPRLSEKGVIALKIRHVGQHRQAAGPASLVGPGQRGRVEVGADQALRRACLLDFGDQRVAAVAVRVAKRLGKPPGCISSARGRVDVGGAGLGLSGSDPVALVCADAFEDVVSHW